MAAIVLSVFEKPRGSCSGYNDVYECSHKVSIEVRWQNNHMVLGSWQLDQISTIKKMVRK